MATSSLVFSNNQQSQSLRCSAADPYLFTSPQECLRTSVMVLMGLPMADYSCGGVNISRCVAAVSGQA